jgi:mono/diheme cytochrome c family protein
MRARRPRSQGRGVPQAGAIAYRGAGCREANVRAQFAMAATMLGLTVRMTLCTSAFAQDAARLAAGEAAWDKAGCLQCHGSAGEGGVGGEFPAGPSLRKTRLDRAALIEAVSCGLPGTQMPGWLDGAYTQRSCYGFPPGPAPDGTTLTPVLSANEVEALADYLLAKIVGR